MVVTCVQASVKARRPPCKAHGNFNASPSVMCGEPEPKKQQVIGFHTFNMHEHPWRNCGESVENKWIQ